MPFDEEKNIKCPQTAPEAPNGLTAEERSRSVRKPLRPCSSGKFAAAAALALIAAFAGCGWQYYRVNLLPEEYYTRAAQLFKAGDYADAEELFDKIKKLRPERRDLFYYKAFCRERQGDKAGAVKYYEEYLKSAPGDVKVMVRLGWLYLDRMEYDAALKWFREAAKQEKKDAALWRLTAEAAENGENGGEITACGKTTPRRGVSTGGADCLPLMKSGAAG